MPLLNRRRVSEPSRRGHGVQFSSAHEPLAHGRGPALRSRSDHFVFWWIRQEFSLSLDWLDKVVKEPAPAGRLAEQAPPQLMGPPASVTTPPPVFVTEMEEVPD